MISRTLQTRWLGVLLATLVVAACAEPPNAEIVVEACLDQHGQPLPPGVAVTVAGAAQTWSAEPLRFPVRVDDGVRLVGVEAEAAGYRYVSKPQYPIRPGEEKALTLRFFRPYVITVEALGRDSVALPDVTVFAEGKPLGTTDSTGRFFWTLDTPGPRPGDRVALALERDGERAEAPALVLAAGTFAYTIRGTLNQDGAEAPEPDDLADGRSAPPAREAVLPAPQPLATRQPEIAPEPATTPEPEPPAPEPAPEPAAPQTPLERADAAFADGRFPEALSLYERIPATEQTAHKRALQQIGRIYLEMERYADAIGAFEQILEEDPSEYAAHNNLAAVYLATNDYGAALGHLEEVLAKKHLIPRAERRPAELEVRYVRAAIHYTQFRNERDPVARREQGLLAMGVLRAFIDQVRPEDGAFSSRRREMEDKLNDLRQWIRDNG